MKHLLSLALLLSTLALPAAAQEEDGAEAPLPRPAKLMTLAEGDTALQREFYGRVEARETVDLAFQVGGQITEFPATEGSRLEEGELIAQLDLDTFSRSLNEAELNRDQAQRDLDRYEQLSGDSVTEVQIQNARTQFNLAQIQFERAQEQLDEATLEAPFDALVARRNAAKFATVAAGEPVVRLHDMSELRVGIDVPEVLFRSTTANGVEAEYYATFPGSEERYPLELREFEAETADIAQTFRVTLAFTTETPAHVLPGASSTVTVRVQADPDAGIVIPETALVFGPEREAYVMAFEPDGEDGQRGTVHRTPVEIEVGDNVGIRLTGGPGTGTEIVETGAALLEDGQRVRRYSGVGQ